MWILIAIVIIVIIILIPFGYYNSLINSQNAAEQMFAQIDVEMQRRNDLIPNLISTVKGYASHEREVLESVTESRQQLVDMSKNATNEQKLEQSDQLSQSLSRLLAVAENYPDLKADRNFLQLQEELTNTENRIAGSRQSYNREVMNYNTKLESVPTNIIGKIFNFEYMTYHEIPESSKEVPDVKF